MRSLARLRRAFARPFPQFRSPEAPPPFDLDSPGATHAPFPALARLRAAGDVHFLPRHGCWIVLGYDAVHEALGRPDLFSSSPQGQIDTILLGADPPGHEGPRRRIAAHLAIAVFAELTAFARARAAELVAPSFDIVSGFAGPLVHSVAAKLVGLGETDLAAVLRAPDLVMPATQMTKRSRELLSASGLYEALVSDRMDAENALSLVRLLCRASTETTERLIARAAGAMLAEPAIHRVGAGSNAAMAALIDEVARLLPPEPNVVRRTVKPVTLAGVALPGDAMVFLSLLAANRDPRRFDAPDELRLDRGRVPHLAFAGGPHHCIGAGLARQLTGAALAALVAGKVRLADPIQPVRLIVQQGIASPHCLMVTSG